MAAIKLVQVLEIFRIIGKQKPELVLLVYAPAEITDIEQIAPESLKWQMPLISPVFGQNTFVFLEYFGKFAGVCITASAGNFCYRKLC